ncbi:hypothetical protein [Naasia aerilata]|uniref:Glycosyltransferase involved in cell wall biosynthesis n=1 Tax=Naasia aerilata TaxID=1162966 RepID=A0ABM8G7K9_9MICO|nr:hypothetical protein [Naasia aerilata]BDZ44142.1 hypothetical protein GCM10025866_00510 [Naasia aerilata]BDZ47755.1 hypothetical protein GCM10025866_36640 [Naasia aerilata]
MTSFLIVNPLPLALHHYVRALSDTLSTAGHTVEVLPMGSTGAEGTRGLRRIAAAAGTLLARALLARGGRSPILIVWPLFGYWDILTWLPASLRRQVIVILHDITPLRSLHGYGRAAHRVFGLVAKHHPRITVVCHTREAAAELHRLTGVSAEVASHPVIASTENDSEAAREPVIRVLGQFKAARWLHPLEAIASGVGQGDHNATLEIKGRGWPSVSGWTVDDRFLTESQFEEAIASASCVVLPYTRFYQSGVAVRCLELGTPVVAQGTEQIRALFGDDWPGIVRDEHDWMAAAARALDVPRAEVLHLRDAELERCVAEWRRTLARH